MTINTIIGIYLRTIHSLKDDLLKLSSCLVADAFFSNYIDPEKKTQTRKVFFSTDTGMNAIDIFDVYRTRFQIEFLYRDSKQFTGLCNCQSRDVKAMDFAFNMSLSTINIARQFGKVYGMDLSVSDVKLLLHNAAMVERIFSTFGNSPNLMKNNTDFKELLFYGLRAAV